VGNDYAFQFPRTSSLLEKSRVRVRVSVWVWAKVRFRDGNVLHGPLRVQLL
jgi:hypothetical protein